jgi:hypothetical protein
MSGLTLGGKADQSTLAPVCAVVSAWGTGAEIAGRHAQILACQ